MASVASLDFGPLDLPGPTGESNQFQLVAKGVVLCMGPGPEALLTQVCQALSCGNVVIACEHDARQTLAKLEFINNLPLAVFNGSIAPEALEKLDVNAVAFFGDTQTHSQFRKILSTKPGAIVPIITESNNPVLYCNERAICIDTTAAGGNASLLAQSDE